MQDAEFLIIRMEGTFTTFPSPIEFDMLCLQILMKRYHTLKTRKFSDKKFGVFPI